MKPSICYLALGAALALTACSDDETKPSIVEDPSTFAEIGQIDLGDEAASEISAYDPQTKQLFVVNNSAGSTIDVVDLEDPALPVKVTSINILEFGAGVNSVAVKDGLLAAAVEATVKTDNGKIVLFKTSDLTKVAEVTAGALPDMVTFSPDGRFILSANEGEPSDDYSVDPVGSVSIISVKENYAVATVDFSGFASSESTLKAAGLRVYGLNATFTKDMEPEYIAVSDDSKTAWVTLQENNGIAKIDLTAKSITNIYPLGFKDHNTDANALDPSDRDNVISLAKFQLKGMYQPDAIASFKANGVTYLISANEGDAREYDGFEEETRVKDLDLDAAIFPNSAGLKADAQLGRLTVTTELGDANGDGVYEALYSFGARSFSIWNGTTGAQVFDSGKKLETDLIAFDPTAYDDTRSDNKGVEPEGVTIGFLNNKTVAFVALERADAVLIYDITNPASPSLLQGLKTGDAPEGILFIPASDSPVGKSLLLVSSEDDGLVKIYQPETL